MSDDASRVIKLRYDGVCSRCDAPQSAGTQAWWDSKAKQVTCLRCKPSEVQFVAGRSARRTAERKAAKEKQEWDDASFLKKAAIVWRDERPRAASWNRGGEGEEIVGARLDALAAEGLIVALHDIRVPRTSANVDHVAVAPSGVHIIDAKYYKNAQVEIVNRGGLLRPDVQLRVRKRNVTHLVDKLSKQIMTIEAQLRDTPLPTVTTPVLCFVDALWGIVKKEYTLNSVRIVPPPRLERLLRREGPLTREQIEHVGNLLRQRLRPA